MEHVTDQSFTRRDERGVPQVLTFSITEPGWKNIWDFEEISLELSPGVLACPKYGCKVYKWKDGNTHLVFHSAIYGCPRGFRGFNPIK